MLSSSYTDEGRLSYFWNNGGVPVPVGTVLPFSPVTSDGGIIWDRWVSIYTNATLYDYATAGAVCSDSFIEKFVPGVSAPILMCSAHRYLHLLVIPSILILPREQTQSTGKTGKPITAYMPCG